VFIATIPNRNSSPAYLLREGYREGGKVKVRTLANLSRLPAGKIEALRAALKGEPAGFEPEVIASLPHGHALAVTGMIARLGLDRAIFARRHRKRELALALVASLVLGPSGRLELAQSLRPGFEHSTLGEVLGLGVADEHEFLEAMDWIAGRQACIEDALAARHLGGGTALLHVIFEGGSDIPGDPLPVGVGLLCNGEGIPVALEAGGILDPGTLPGRVEQLKARFHLDRVLVVDGRGLADEAGEALGDGAAARARGMRAQAEGAFRAMMAADPRTLASGLPLDRHARAHLLLCMLSYGVERHLRKAWESLLSCEDGTLASPADPGRDAQGTSGVPRQTFRGLLQGLATMTSSQVRLGAGGPVYVRVSNPTGLQRRALALIGL
jgi:hypothetical protein